MPKQTIREAFHNVRPTLIYIILFISLVGFWVVAWVLGGDCNDGSVVDPW